MTEDRITKLQQKMVKLVMEELQGRMNDLMKGMLDPSKIMALMRSMGIDMGQFSQMFGRMAQTGTMPPGFDPYAFFHLDKSASDEEVKQAYRKVMSTIHPDKAGPELTTLAAITNAAYNLIEKERGWQ